MATIQKASSGQTGFKPNGPAVPSPFSSEFQNAQSGVFFHHNASTNYSFFPSDSDRPTVVAFAGLNEPEALSMVEKRKLVEAGFPILEMGFVPTNGRAGFIEKQSALVEGMITHRNSPLHQIAGREAQFRILAHSTSVIAILGLTQKPHALESMQGSKPVLISPPFEPPFASKDHPFQIAGIRPLHLAFELYARLNADRSMTESCATRLYHRLKGETGLHEKYAGDPRTWRQVIEVLGNSRAIMRDFNYEAAASLDPMIIHGSRDPYTRTATTKRHARDLGAVRVTVDDGGHSYHLEKDVICRLVVDHWSRPSTPSAEMAPGLAA